MKICIVDSFPNQSFTAEKEFIRRLQIVGRRFDVDVVRVETSNEIIHECPDFVLATHEFTPKLTDHTTLGLLWSPPEFFIGDITRVRNVLSYDGIYAGSSLVESYMRDLTAECPGQGKPIANFRVLPSCQRLEGTQHTRNPRTLFYAGVHWDGSRHGCLFHLLDQSNSLNVYGPKKSWDYISRSYRGEIPFDGQSLFEAISRHGISLCLHRDEHIAANTPSMRLFEAAASGSLIISDHIPFAKQVFGDSIFVIDPGLSSRERAEFIREKIIWARENPDKADSMSSQSRAIFERDWSLDTLLPKIIEFGRDVHGSKYSLGVLNVSSLAQPSLDVIIRCGSRPPEVVRRAIQSALTQQCVKARVLLVDFSGLPCFRELANEYGEQVQYIHSLKTGYRSTSLWDGLRNVSADFFAVLDDDDTVHRAHWSRLIEAILLDKTKHGRTFAYSGVVRIEEDGAFVSHPSFVGDMSREIKETRELKFLDLFDPARLLIYDNYIQSNAWVAKRSILKDIVFDQLEDPCLEVAEDVFLYLHFLSVTNFIPVLAQTANWHWRSHAGENSMLAVDQQRWRCSINRALLRLDQKLFRGTTFRDARRTATATNIELRLPTLIASELTTSTPRLVLGSETFKPAAGFIYQCESAGFCDGEPSGSWSNEEFAWIRVHTPQPTQIVDVRLSVKIPPHESGRPQRLKVLVNGIEIFNQSAQPWKQLNIFGCCTLPESVSMFTITFMIESCFNPFLLGEGTEARDLGVLVSSIRLRPAFTSFLGTLLLKLFLQSGRKQMLKPRCSSKRRLALLMLSHIMLAKVYQGRRVSLTRGLQNC